MESGRVPVGSRCVSLACLPGDECEGLRGRVFGVSCAPRLPCNHGFRKCPTHQCRHRCPRRTEGNASPSSTHLAPTQHAGRLEQATCSDRCFGDFTTKGYCAQTVLPEQRGLWVGKSKTGEGIRTLFLQGNVVVTAISQ